MIEKCEWLHFSFRENMISAELQLFGCSIFKKVLPGKMLTINVRVVSRLQQ